MIQRIQTVYLLLAVVAMALLFAFKIAEVSTDTGVAVLTAYGATANGDALALEILVLPPWIFTALITVVLAACIASFKNRKRQMVLGRLSYLLILGFLVYLYFAADSMADALKTTDAIRYGAGIYLPVAAIAFVFLANRAIKKDEDLVRSLDRLR